LARQAPEAEAVEEAAQEEATSAEAPEPEAPVDEATDSQTHIPSEAVSEQPIPKDAASEPAAPAQEPELEEDEEPEVFDEQALAEELEQALESPGSSESRRTAFFEETDEFRTPPQRPDRQTERPADT